MTVLSRPNYLPFSSVLEGPLDQIEGQIDTITGKYPGSTPVLALARCNDQHDFTSPPTIRIV